MRRRGSSVHRSLAALLCLALSTGCISTWNTLPSPARSTAGARLPETLAYDVSGAEGMFGGGEAVRKAFREDAPFMHVEPLSAPPRTGLFCRVDTERHAPNVASGIFGYLSYAFLFLIPFWSTEGYTLRYHMYVDGEEKKIFEYDVMRKSYFWLVLLPVSWVSLLTPSEGDAFSATARQFFADVQPYVRGETPWPR